MSTVLLPQLGIADQVLAKSVRVRTPKLVGEALLDGEADFGLQQMSELLAVPGIEVVGPLPAAAQRVDVIAAALTTTSRQPDAAAAWIGYLGRDASADALREAGFEPSAFPAAAAEAAPDHLDRAVN